ncbi:MAG: hypothetical protein V1799_12945 [bacterium]
MNSYKLVLKKALSLKFFFIGIIVAATLHGGWSCKHKDNPVADEPVVDAATQKQIEDGATSVQEALKTGDAQKVLATLTESAKSTYSQGITALNKDDLIKLGQSLQSKQLILYGDLYAEYKYTFNGVEYSIGLARQADNSWKLMRF